jgi:hypothetical protein
MRIGMEMMIPLTCIRRKGVGSCTSSFFCVGLWSFARRCGLGVL